MRIFTCTPVAFGGGAVFFARDSGLLCRGFQAIGIDSRAVMPGMVKPEDEGDLIRTEYRNLESADWWRSQNIDSLVLYAWGRPKFRKVAAAIQEAGIFLVLNLDSGGPVSPLAGWRDWVHAQWIYGGHGRGFSSWIRFIKLTLRGLTMGVLMTDPLRARHLKCGNAITCVSPLAAEYFRRLCRIYGGMDLAARVTVIPHAVESRFGYSGREKQRQVACVGRWKDQVQKRRWLLMEVMDMLLSQDDRVNVVIAGEPAQELEAWHHGLGESQRSRVRLAGIIGRNELAALLDESQVFYSPSAYESFGIAAAEALCSGCSVVAGRSITLPAFEWFVSEESGQLAESDACIGHAGALQDELDRWNNGGRNARSISDLWCERLHADRVATRVVEMMRDR